MLRYNKKNKKYSCEKKLLISINSILVFLFIIFNLSFFIDKVQAVTLLADNFVGTTIDTVKWQEVDVNGIGGATGDVQQNNLLTIIGNSSWGGNRIVSQNTFNRSDTPTLQADFSINASGVFSAPVIFGKNTLLNDSTADNYFILIHNTNNFYIARGDGGTWTTLTSTGVPVVVGRRYRGVINIGATAGATFEIYQDLNNDGDFNDVGENIDLLAGKANSIAAGSLTSGYFMSTMHSSTATTTIYDVQVTSNLNAPDAPLNLSAMSDSNDMSLYWVAPSSNGGAPITDYIIEYKLASSSTWLTFTDGVSTNTRATLTGLLNNESYNFRVSAVNLVGTGSVSSTATATTNFYTLLDVFTGTTIDTSKWIELDSGGLGGTVGNVQQNNSLTATGSNAWGTNGLKSVNTFDRSNGDVEITATMQTTSCATGNSLEFGYGDIDISNNGTSYIITKNSNIWYLYNWLNGVSAGATTISGVSCTDNTDLTMKLVVLQGGGAEVYVNGATTPSATTTWGTITNRPVWIQNYSSGVTTTFQNISVKEPAPVPSAPTNLNAISGDTQVDLSWTAANGNGSAITDYVIEYKLASSSTWLTFTDGVSTNISTTVTGLNNGFNYNFRVSAVNTNGTSSVSSLVSSKPVSSVATAPSVSSVVVTGSVSVGELVTGTYTFNDVNGDSEATSLYRWLISDTVNGTYSPIAGATNINYTVKSSDLNKYLKFEVTPVTSVNPTTGNAVLSTASSQINAVNYFNHILSTGQSLSTGQGGAPALSISQPYNNKMLSGSSLVPLVESSVETMSSALANTLTALSPNGDYQSAVTRHGVGATTYSGLKKGTTAYNNGMTQTTNVKNAATALGMTDRVIGVTTIHGESDHIAGNGAAYQSYLEEWQSDYETDVKAITGQSGTIPLFTDQMSSHTNYSATTSLIPIAQLSAAEDNPGKIVLVAPKYFFNYSSGAHLTNTSYRWLGEYYGKVIKKVVLDGELWRPLSPNNIVLNGNIIYAQFHVPEGELAFDTTLVSPRTNYGFEYYDSTNSAVISNVELLDTETVKITLSGVPTGSGQQLRYAYTGVSGSVPGAQNAGSAAGNLRDTDATLSLYGNTLYNWAVHFDKSITMDSSLPINSNLNITPADTAATITWTTNEVGSSIVEYGLTSSYGNSTIETDAPTRVVSHSSSLSNLVPCTKYHYRTKSKDLAQNQGVSSDQTFITSGCTGSAGVENIGTNTVAVSTGSTLTLNSGTANLSLNIPGNFSSVTSSNIEFQLKQLTTNSVITTTGNPNEKNVVGDHIYELSALKDVNTTVDNFDKDLTVTVTYTDSEINGLDETTIAIYYWTGSAWSVLNGCSVDTSANTVSCVTNHFTTFGVFGAVSSAVTGGASRIIPYSIGNGVGNNYINIDQTRNGYIIDKNGSNFLVYINSSIGFTVDGTDKKYVAKIKELNMFNKNVEIILLPNSVIIDLYPNEVKEIDLNKDGVNDIKIKYNDLKVNNIDITITKLEGKNIKQEQSNDKEEVINDIADQKMKYTFTRNLKLGMSGQDVKELQKYLNNNGFVLADSGQSGSAGYETEFFGRATKNALIKFQNKYSSEILEPVGLSVGTGYFGPSTIKFVNWFGNKEQFVPEQKKVIERIKISSLFTNGLAKGTMSNDVRKLQKLLFSLPSIYPEGIVSGYFGSLTEKAVQRFQLKYGVVKGDNDIGYGYVGPATRKKLSEVFGK